MKGKESKKVSTSDEWNEWKNSFRDTVAKTLKNARMRIRLSEHSPRDCE